MSSDAGARPGGEPARGPAEGPDDGEDRGPGPAAGRPPRRGLLSPSTLEPVELDLRRVFWAGIVLWAVAGAVCAVLLATGQATARALVICGAGICLGFGALLWESRRRRH